MQLLRLAVALSILRTASANIVYVTETAATPKQVIVTETAKAGTTNIVYVTKTAGAAAPANTVHVTETHYATVYVTVTANTVEETKYVTIPGPTTFVTKVAVPSSSSSTSLVAPTTSILEVSTSSVSAAPKPTTTLSSAATTLSSTTTLSSVATSLTSITTLSSVATTLTSITKLSSVTTTLTPTTQSSVKTTSSVKSSSSTSSTTVPSSTGDIYAEIYKSPTLNATFAKGILDAHNVDRALHSAPALTWNKTLYDYAQAYADTYSCGARLVHSGGHYGENLGVGYAGGVEVVEAWYREGENHDYSETDTYSHFTAVIWKSTTRLGCAIKDCRGNNWGWYIICSYDPSGNVIGRIPENVFPH